MHPSRLHPALLLALIPASSLLAPQALAVVPPHPTLTTAGQVIHDANDAASTLLMRVTDASTMPGGGINSYSYYPTFNSNSTKIILGGYNGGSYLYDFNPNTFTLGARNLFLSNPAGSGPLDWQDAIWSSTDPNVIYAHANIGTKLWAYNVVANTYTLVKDFSVVAGTPSATGNSNPYIWQMSKSKDDNTFGFSIRYNDNSSYPYTGYVAWNKTTNTFLANNAKPAQGLDEVQVDKTGQYLVVKTEAQGANQIRAQILDLQNHTTTNMLDGVNTVGHSDNGTGKLVTSDNWNNSIVLRNLATPTAAGTTLISMGNDWTNANHISMLANDESKVLISYFGTTNGAWTGDSRLVWVNTDGSGTMTPLAYHYSVYHDYYDSPRADISADGRFIAFTSNWGDSGREDVFILQIAMLGDANRDGNVNFADFTALSNHFGGANPGWTGGDFNGDGAVNFADFTILSNNFGKSTTGSGFIATPDELAAMNAFAATNIPEPASLSLLAIGALALLARRAKQNP